MKKIGFIALLAVASMACQNGPATNQMAMNEAKENKVTMTETKSFHNFTVTDINGESFDLSSLKGKRVLVVNTASECGFTPQYEDLQKLYEQYGGENFTIIGFPCNQFGGQEPGSNEEIKAFCQKNYGVSFPMMDKVDVKGDGQHPLYAWLTNKEQNGVDDASVSWNFNKFLIDENGQWVEHFGSMKNPLSDEIVAFAKGA